MPESSAVTETLVSNLVFPEGIRWHDDRLWFSDMRDRRVVRLDDEGSPETVVEVPNQPSGLGWTTDDRLLVVSMEDRRLLRLDPGGLTEVADLTALSPWHCNDMVVDGRGRAYVGNFGAPLGSDPGSTTTLVLVDPDGRARVAADGLSFPNGCAVTLDGGTLILAESGALRISAFKVATDGSLSEKRVFADLKPVARNERPVAADGLCLDAEGAVWFASPVTREVIRIRDGGEVTDRISTGRPALSCALGGVDGRTLYICTAANFHPDEAAAERSGQIDTARVAVEGVEAP